MARRTEYIPGFSEAIHSGVWNRQMFCWVPKKFFTAWVGICAYFGLLIVYFFPWKWLILIGAVWLIGQVGMMRLTRWDNQWDEICIQWLRRWLRRRYKKRYLAG